MASATPDLRLPYQPQGWYQIILLGDRDTCVNNLLRVALDSGEARNQTQPAIQHPNHSATESCIIEHVQNT